MGNLAKDFPIQKIIDGYTLALHFQVMNVKVSKWGNSLAVRIPSNIARSIHLHEGGDLEINEDGEKIILKPVKEKKYSMDSLLSEVKKDNIHTEFETSRVGSEEW